MTSLRTIWGMDIRDSRLQMADIMTELKNIDASFYILKDNILTLTQAGKHYADRIAADLFIED